MRRSETLGGHEMPDGCEEPGGSGIDCAELAMTVLGRSPLSMWSAEAGSRLLDTLNGRAGDDWSPEESEGDGDGR